MDYLYHRNTRQVTTCSQRDLWSSVFLSNSLVPGHIVIVETTATYHDRDRRVELQAKVDDQTYGIL